MGGRDTCARSGDLVVVTCTWQALTAGGSQGVNGGGRKEGSYRWDFRGGGCWMAALWLQRVVGEGVSGKGSTIR